MGNNIKNQIDNLNYNNAFNAHTFAEFKTVGWYRIAKFTASNYHATIGAEDNSLDIIIKRSFSYLNNEHHEIKLLSIYNRQEFKSIVDISNNQLITKIRYTTNKSNTAYIEIYYCDSLANMCLFILNNRCSSNCNFWEPCLEATEESVDGFTVTATFDIPTNS